MSSSDAAGFVVILEKKGRGRGFAIGRPWTVRTFTLSAQTLQYFDGDKLKGDVSVKDSNSRAVPPAEADGKEFPFEMLTVGPSPEKIILNASSDEIRKKCIEVFNKAAKDPNWTLQEPVPPAPPSEEQMDYEKAAAAAVVTAMAADAEKKRLEEEARRLEEQRQREVTEGAAAVMQEELANAKLREAKEAEEQQKREQEKQVMESFKGMGAKMRFRSAIQHGMLQDAKDAAALMLQGAWRAKVARRQAAAKKAQKQQLQREGYAKKIQSRYRARLARKKVLAIKAEKLRIQQQLCALKLQCAWRIHNARRAYRVKQEAAAEMKYNKQIARARAVIVMQNQFRACLARRRIRKMKISFPYVLRCTVLSADANSSVGSSVASSKKAGDFGAESMMALVSGMVLTLPRDSPELHSPLSEVTDEMLRTQGKLTSLYQCRPMPCAGIAAAADGDAAAEEGGVQEYAVATALNKMDYLVVTLLDAGANKGDFLGQALIRLISVPRLESGESVEVTALLQKMKKTVTNASGEALGTVRKAPQGMVRLQLSRPNANYNLCGWLWKVSESLLSNAWKRRWFLLLDGELRYYNSDLGMETEKNVVPCCNVTMISEIEFKGRHALKIEFTSDSKENFWCIDFEEDAPAHIRQLWKRVLYRNCPQIPDPLLTALGIKPRALPAASAATAHKNASQKKTALPAKKRLSIFS